jgi:hypothetical protein
LAQYITVIINPDSSVSAYGIHLSSLQSGERTSPDGINIVPIVDVRESNNVVLAQHG